MKALVKVLDDAGRCEILQGPVFAALPEDRPGRIAGEARETELLPGQLRFDPEDDVVASGLVRAFLADGAVNRPAHCGALRSPAGTGDGF